MQLNPIKMTPDIDEELYELFTIEVDKGQQPMRVDKFITNRIEKISRNKIQQASKADCLHVNGEPVKVNYKIKPGDQVSLYLLEEPNEFTLVPEQMDLDIIFEDNDVMVINKAPGMVVHPGCGNWTGTLAHGIAYHLGNIEGRGLDKHRPGIVHRIDKYTSGLLVVAKNSAALSNLSAQFAAKTTDRIYQALVWGDFEQQQDTIIGNIARSTKNRKIFQVYDEESIGKHAVTHYRVLEDFCYVSLVECKLETGRTHQIRVHMKHIGHPLFADAEYGGDNIVKGTVFTKYKQFVDNCFKLCNRQALHAKSLAFDHPVTGQRMSFSSDLPEDMQALVNKWRNYSLQLKQ